MYHVYVKKETGFESKKLVGEYRNLDDAYAKVEKEMAKDKDTKYVIEETTGHVDNYGELIATVVEEN